MFGSKLQNGVLWLLLAQATALYAQSNPTSAQMPSRTRLSQIGLTLAWWGQAMLNPSRDRVRYMVADEQFVFVQSSGGIVTAFDSETGKRMWAMQLGPADSPAFPAVSNDEYVMIVAGTQMYSIHKRTGDVIWEIPLAKQPSTAPAADNDQVYVGCIDGSVFAYNLRKVHQLFNENLLPQYIQSGLLWRFKTAKEVTTPPVTTGSFVNFASRDSSLYCVSAQQRKLIFQLETNQPVSAPLAEADGFVFLASEDTNLACVNMTNGRVLWDFVAGVPIRKKPQVIGDQVYVLPQRNGMYCLSRENGEQLWWNSQVTEFLAASSQLVYGSDSLGNVLLIARDNGATLGGLPYRFFPVRVSNFKTDRLFLATESGLVISIREEEIEFPLYHLHPNRRPILPVLASENPEDDEPKAEKPAAEEPAGQDPFKTESKTSPSPFQ